MLWKSKIRYSSSAEPHATEVVQSVIETYGHIDIDILNVGIGPPTNTLTASAGTIKFSMRANYDILINFYCSLMRQMLQQTTPCMIAHVNSQASYVGIPMQGDYTATTRSEVHAFWFFG